jgi:hypothetical protein
MHFAVTAWRGCASPPVAEQFVGVWAISANHNLQGFDKNPNKTIYEIRTQMRLEYNIFELRREI